MVSADVGVQSVQVNTENHDVLLGALLNNLMTLVFFISDKKGRMKILSPKRNGGF